MTQHLDTDIAILGGGIAGLWLFRRLSELGYSTLLLESSTLGGEQTIKSQGIIHGGTKYALSGNLTKASECIASMPQRWRDCMEGNGEIDLTQAQLLSPHHYMWSSSGIGSKLTTFFASKALRGRVDALDKSQYPEFFQHPKFRGNIYKLNEFVLDIGSVITALTEGLLQRTIKIDWQHSQLETDEQGQITAITTGGGEDACMIRARRYVFAAGAGTADLISRWGIDGPEMQLRPLHMCMVKVPNAAPLFAHCIGTSTVPRLTITSHPTADGQWIWYIGGEPAETGVNRTSDEQIAVCQQELKALMPWVDLSSAQWATLRANRAEPKQNSLLRPDAAFCKSINNCFITWPTKLALAPNLSDEVIKHLNQQEIKPQFPQPERSPLLQGAEICQPFWSDAFS